MTATALSYEQRLKDHYAVRRNRLMNPKNGKSESKVVRVVERAIIATDKPIRKGFTQGMDPLTVSHIRAAYEAGTPITGICDRFHISHRTLRRLRQKYEWPIRERIR